jgi:tricorn protease-like protein
MVAYSSEKTTLYYMLLDGVSTRVALLNENVSTYAIGDDRIFFCSGSENALYSINIDGTDKKKIADVEGLAGPGTTDPNYYLDVVGDKVFMFDSNDGQAVYMIDLVSGEVVNLFDEKN